KEESRMLRLQLVEAELIISFRIVKTRKVGGGGEIDIVILDVLKGSPASKDLKVLTVPHFVREFNPKQPWLAFGYVYESKPDFHRVFGASTALIDYSRLILKLDAKKPRETLRFYF